MSYSSHPIVLSQRHACVPFLVRKHDPNINLCKFDIHLRFFYQKPSFNHSIHIYLVRCADSRSRWDRRRQQRQCGSWWRIRKPCRNDQLPVCRPRQHGQQLQRTYAHRSAIHHWRCRRRGCGHGPYCVPVIIPFKMEEAKRRRQHPIAGRRWKPGGCSPETGRT